MKVLALNGSARKEWNSATMLKSAMEGAASTGAETKLVHLYDLNFKGCIGCHACKLKDEKFFARCAQNDELTSILEEAIDTDVLLLSSPIYFNDVTGTLRSFLERFWFPAITYNKDRVPTYPKRIKVGFICTTNAPDGFYKDFYNGLVQTSNRIIGETELVSAAETIQFKDYSKYHATMFDVEARVKRHEEIFPEDCKRAFEMGKRLATQD